VSILDDARKRKWDRERAERNGHAERTNYRYPDDASGKQGEPIIRPVFRDFANIKPRRVDWLWPGRIPRGMLSVCDGDPGNGKSTIMCDLAARVSRGWAMPDEPADGPVRPPAGVLLLNAEDDPECTIRPRLDAAGADVRRVHILTGIRVGDEEDERPPVLPCDLTFIEAFIRDREVALVIVDPLMAFLDAQIDAHKDSDVRRCMHRMALVGQKTGAAMQVIRHLNKLIGGPALYRGGGSIGISGACRSALMVGKDPADPQHFVLASVKSNLSATPASLIYTHEPVGDVTRIAWVGETLLGPDDILGHAGPKAGRSVAQQCADAIRDLLVGSAMESAEFERQLGERGFGVRAVRDGRRLAAVRTYKVGFGADAKWMVVLQSQDKGEAEADNAQTP
jgi:hypothetical protein